MTRHVCGICGYSLDDADYTGSLSASMTMHMHNAHCPQVIYTNIPDKDEVVYKLLVQSGLDDGIEDAIAGVRSFKDAWEKGQS